MMGSISKKVYVITALILVLVVGCRQIWNGSEPAPPAPDYNILLDEVPAIKVDSTYEISVLPDNSEIDIVNVEWSSDDNSVVTVTPVSGTSSAILTAISSNPKNSAIITVTTTDQEGNTKSEKVEVLTYSEVETLSLSGPTVVAVGDTPVLTVDITPESAQTAPLVWSRTGEIALDINAESGDITTKASGISKITVTADDTSGKTDTHDMVVVDFPKEIPPGVILGPDGSVMPSNPSSEGAVWIPIGKHITLPSPAPLGSEFQNLLAAGTPKWVSADETYVSVAADTPGKLNGVKAEGGEFPIKVTLTTEYTYDELVHTLNAEYPVYVADPSIGVTSSTGELSRAPSVTAEAGIPSIEVEVDTTRDLSMFLHTDIPGITFTNVIWTSDNPSHVMVVDEKNGIIKGIKSSAIITATDQDTKLTAQIEVKVTGAGPDAIEIVSDSGELVLPVNKNSLPVSLVFEPEGTESAVSWDISDENLATIVDGGFKGVVVSNDAGKTGSAIVVVTSELNPEVKGLLDVTVYDIIIDGTTGIDDNTGSTELTVKVIPENDKTAGVDLSTLGTITWSIDQGASIASLKVDESDPRKVTVSAKPEEIATRALREEKSPSVVKISVLTGNGLKTNVDVYINPLYVDSVSITPPATPPEGAELVDDSTLIINTKSGFVLGTELDPVEASNTSIAWSVEPEGILSVQGGSVNSLGPLGTATVTATAKGAKDGEIKESHFIVKVRDFELKYGKSYIPVGAEGETLTGAMLPSSSYGTLDLGEWKSTSPGKLEIDADTGELTPKSGGTVEITATDATTGLTRSYEIIVAELTGLIGQSTIEQGSQTTLDHSVKGITKDDLGELTWTSEDPSVAVIDMTSGSPMAKGVGAGTTTLTVTDNAGLTATVEVTVTNIVAEGVSINEDVTTLAVGSSSTYTATTSPETLTTNGVVWSLEEETPAEDGTTVGTIDKNGKFVAKNPGTVTIVVTTKDSVGSESPVTDTIKVTVQKFIANPKEIVIKKGEVVSLGYEIIPEGTADVGTFSGYNTEVVKVDAGEVTGLSAGTTTITAVDDVTGLSAKTKVTVWDIEIQGASTLAKGASSEYTLVKKPTNEVIASSEEAKISWDIPEFNYAWVDEGGKVTAEAKPAAPIAPATRANIANVKLMARYEGLTAEHPIAIDGVDVTGIAITSTVKEVNVDKSITITAEVTPSHASEKGIEWSLAAGDEEFATINSTTGVLRGKAPGYVTVTAKAKGAPEGKELIAQEDVTVLALDISVPNRVQVPDSFTIGVTTQPTKQAPTMEGWKSSDESVATVDENGNVKTLKPGITTITATDSSTGMVIEYELVVYGLKVEGLPELTAGATSTYTAVLQPLSNPEGLTLGTVSWSVTSGEISGGDFTAPLVPGEVTITATDTDNNIAGTLVVKIIDKKVSDIEIINERDINITEKFQLEIELTPEDATNQKVTWESSAPDVVEVTQKGVISGKKAGTADITVTALGGAEGETVSDKVSIMVRDFAISLKEEDKNIFEKEEAVVQVELKPEDYGSDITWRTESSEIVSVAGGIITGKSMGTATIEAIDGTTGLKRSVAITISNIEIQGETQSLVKGESTDLKLVKIPGGSEITSTTEDPINWSVSNSNIAWVDKDGVVRAESKPVEPSTPATLQAMTLEGETEPSGDENVVTVYAKYKGLTAKYVMNITPMYVTDIQITPEESVLVNVGESVQLNAVVTPENASNLGVGWSIDPSQYAIATVDEKGKVTGLSPGSVTVKATAKGGSVAGEPSTTKEVTVRDIALKSPKNYVLAGSDFAPVVSILPFENVSADMGDWTASPEDTLRYNEETGKFEALKGGSATITGTDATTGLTRTFDINIAQLKVTGPATIEQGKESSNFSVSLIKGNADIDLGTVNWSADPSNGVEIIPAESGNTMKVKGLVPGEVTITATDSNGITGTATIEVTYVPVTSITLEGEDGADKVSVNNSINLTATVLPENATTQGVTWSIKEGGEDIASVSQNGKVTGKQVGKVTVVAKSKSEGTVVGEYEVTVRDLEVTVDKSEIYKGETATITAKILPENSGDANITKWEPTNENGEVSGSATSATVEGKSSGYLTITVTDGETGRSKPVKITISDIEIRGKIANVPAGGELQLELWKVPGNEKIESGVSWEVNPSSVATIDGSTGKLTASTDSAAAGQSVVVTARLEGTNLSTTYDVTVEGIDVTDITIEEPTTILVGPTVQLNATITPENASNKKVRWETAADTAIAEVTSEGKIKGHQAGTIKVKAIAVGDETLIAETFITIRDLELGVPEVATIQKTLSPVPVIKPNDESTNMSKWSSSNTSVATIDSDTGEITTIAGGFTLISGTHTETDSEGNEIEVTSTQTLNVLELKLAAEDIAEGTSTDMTVTLESGKLGLDLGTVTWSYTSEDGGKIKIDTSGEKPVVTGVAAGTVTIKGVDSNGAEGYVTIEVTKQMVEGLALEGDTYINLGTGETLTITATVTPENATNKKVKWEIASETPVVEGETVATITQAGVVTGVSAGTVTVKATALGSEGEALTETHKVVVRELVFDLVSNVVNKSETEPFEITAKYIPEGSGTPKIDEWGTSADTVGKISFVAGSSTVSVTPVGPGEVSISATDTTGMKHSQVITVRSLKITGSPTVSEGLGVQLTANLLPGGKAVTLEAEWSSWKEEYAWVNNTDKRGYVTAAEKPADLPARLLRAAPRQVTIEATYDGLQATHELSITDSPATSLEISVPGFEKDDKARVTVGGNLRLEATVGPHYASDKSVTWSISPDSDQSLAKINPNTGMLTAGDKPGVVEVLASANGAAEGEPEVRSRMVYITKLAFRTEPRSWLTREGGNFTKTTLQVEMLPPAVNITPEMSWSNISPDVVSVSDEGVVTAGTLPSTITITGTDAVTNDTISHDITLVDLTVKLDTWVAKGQQKPLEVSLLPAKIPADVEEDIALMLSYSTPGSTNNISIMEGDSDTNSKVKGTGRHAEGETATVVVYDNTTGLSVEKNITVVELRKKSDVKSWVPVTKTIDLSEFLEILPESAGITADMEWTSGDEAFATIDGQTQIVTAGADYGSVNITGKDKKTGHEIFYPLDVVDIEIINAPTHISSANGEENLDIQILPGSAGLTPEEAWKLTTGDKVISLSTEGLLQAKGETGSVTVTVTDGVTGIIKTHSLEAVDFTLVPVAGETALGYIFTGDTLKLEAKLSASESLNLDLQWNVKSEPGQAITKDEEALTATFKGISVEKDVVITAKDAATGLSATYTITVAGVRFKDDQPLWIPKGTGRTQISAEILPEGIVPDPIFNWSVVTTPGNTTVAAAGASTGNANVTGGDTSGYAEIKVSVDSPNGTTISATHEIAVVELRIEGSGNEIPVTIYEEDPSTAGFYAYYRPNISSLGVDPKITWSAKDNAPGVVARDTTINSDTGDVTAGKQYGGKQIWATDETTGLATSLDLTVYDIGFPPYPNTQGFLPTGKEMVLVPQVRPSTAEYTFSEDLVWSLFDPASEGESYLVTLPTIDNAGTTVSAGKAPGKVLIRAFDPVSGLTAEHPLFVATLQVIDPTPKWAPVTKSSNYRDLKAQLLPTELTGEGTPIPYPEFVWEIVPSEDTPDETEYTGAAKIVGPEKDRVKGESYGKVQVKVTEKTTGLVQYHDMWIAEFILQGSLADGEKPTYVTAGGGQDITTITPMILPEDAGLTPDVVWTDNTGSSAEFVSDSGTITGLEPHKSVGVSAKDNLTGETVPYTFAVLGYSIVEEGPTWIQYNGNEKTFTAQYLPEGVDVTALGLTPDIKWTDDSGLAAAAKADEYTGTLSTSVVGSSVPLEEVTGDVVVTSKDLVTGLSATHDVIVGALEVVGLEQARKADLVDLELVRYPLEYGIPANSKWEPEDDSHVSVNSVTGGGGGRGYLAVAKAEKYKEQNLENNDPDGLLNPDDPNDKWIIPPGKIEVTDLDTGLETTHGIAVAPDYMLITVKKMDRLSIPSDNADLLIDWDGDGLYTKGGGSGNTYNHSGGDVIITQLADEIDLTGWHYQSNNGTPMKNSLEDVKQWGHANFTGAKEAFRTYTALKHFTATDSPILGGDLSAMFYQTTNFTGIGLQYWDVGKVTNMNQMFAQANGLTGLYDGEDEDGNSVTKNVFTGWDVRQVTTARAMFANVMKYTGNYMSDLNWESLTDGYEMFFNADGLIGENMNNWNMPKVENVLRFFANSDNYIGEGSSNWYLGNLSGTATGAGAYNFFNGTKVIGNNMKNWHWKGPWMNIGGVYAGTQRIRDGIFRGVSAQLTGVGMSDWTFSTVESIYALFDYGNTGYNRWKNLSWDGMTGWSFPDATDARFVFAHNNYDVDISGWSFPKAENVYGMFNISNFTGEGVSDVDFSSATNVSNMFYAAKFTGKDAKNWTFGKVGSPGAGSMATLFGYTNSTLTGEGMSGWKFPEATSAASAFLGHGAQFTGEGMSDWSLPKVKNMTSMFQNASKFNGPVDTWTIGAEEGTDFSGATLNNMFNRTVMDQDLSSWDISGATSKTGMFTNAPILSSPEKLPVGYP